MHAAHSCIVKTGVVNLLDLSLFFQKYKILNVNLCLDQSKLFPIVFVHLNDAPDLY